MKTAHPSLTINIDGGSRGNPGPAGAGVVVRAAGGAVVAQLGVFIGRATNNVAEYTGLLAGLKKARDLGARKVKVLSDSQLLVFQMIGRYRVKNPHLAEMLLEAKGLEAAFDEVDYQHIPREQNSQADELANEAMDRRRSFERDLGPATGTTMAADRVSPGSAVASDGRHATPSEPGMPRVYGLQADIVWEDKGANFEHVTGMLTAAGIAPGSFVCLSEMFATGFSMNLPAIVQSDDREDEHFLAESARRFQCTILGGVVTAGVGGKCYNQAVAFGPDGREVARYSKMYPFTFANEDKFFLPGEKVAVFDWAGVKVAPLVCYDLRFPEAFRQAVRLGAEVLVVIANWPKSRENHWRTLLPARAVENQAYVVGVNRVGKSPAGEYHGGSMIVDPDGKIVADAGSAEKAISVSLDLAGLREYRQKFSVLTDIRKDLLGSL